MSGKTEMLAIPDDLRLAVDERDGQVCRCCGEFLGERRALHHIAFGRGFGARRLHRIDNLITVGWLPGNRDCHGLVHRQRHRFEEILLQLASGRHGGITALQLLRWQLAQTRHSTRSTIPPNGRLLSTAHST